MSRADSPKPRHPGTTCRTSCGQPGGDPGTTSASSTERHALSSRRWGRRWTTRRGDTHALRCGDDGLSPIHSTYYRYSTCSNTSDVGKAASVKFRCEREVLADALATAGRAATSRTGTLPVLSGLRLEVQGDELSVTGTDLELSIRLTVAVGGERDGAVVVPARLVADIVRSLPAGAVEVALGRRRGEHQRRDARSSRSARSALDDYPVQVEPAAEAVTLASTRGRRGAAPGRAGGQHRRRPRRADRRADRRRGRRRADGRHRLVPARRARPARQRDARGGPEGAGAEPGAERAAARARRHAESCRCGSAPATRCSRPAARASRRA